MWTRAKKCHWSLKGNLKSWKRRREKWFHSTCSFAGLEARPSPPETRQESDSCCCSVGWHPRHVDPNLCTPSVRSLFSKKVDDICLFSMHKRFRQMLKLLRTHTPTTMARQKKSTHYTLKVKNINLASRTCEPMYFVFEFESSSESVGLVTLAWCFQSHNPSHFEDSTSLICEPCLKRER